MNAKPLRFLAAALGLMVLAGCSSQKEPATQAIAGIERSVAELKADGERFASDQMAAVDRGVAELKDAFDKEDYETVVTRTPAVQTQVSSLRDTVAARRTEFEAASARATEAWNGYAAEMPRYLDTLQKRLDTLAKGRRRAPEPNTDSLMMDNVRNLWADAGNLFSSGNAVEAAARADEARAKARELAQKLGAKLE